MMRMAIVSALTKEGAEAFNRVIEETFNDTSIIAVSPSDLAKFGLGTKGE